MNIRPIHQITAKILAATLIVMLALAALPVQPAYAVAWTIAVNITTDENTANTNCSLREAVIAANTNADYRGCTRAGGTAGDNADIITLTSGSTYILSLAGAGEDASATGDLDVTDATGLTTINTSGVGTAAIDANDIDRILDVRPNASFTLSNIIVTDGTATAAGGNNGGGMRVTGTGTTTVIGGAFNLNQTVLGGAAGTQTGGAIYVNGSTLVLNTVTFTSNAADENGGGLYIDGAASNVTIWGSTFQTHNDAAINDGAAIFLNAGTLTIDGSAFINNDTDNGGAIAQAGGTLNIGTASGNSFTNNDATTGANGGAIYITGGTATTIGAAGVVNTFTTNTSQNGNGGAIYTSVVNLTITDASFTSNSCTTNGGAIYVNSGIASIANTTFTNQNNAAINDGAGIYINAGTVTVSGSTFTGNRANEEGGAIYKNGGSLTIQSNSTFDGNFSINSGGAIYTTNAGNLTISDSIFRNHNDANIDNGAAIYVNGGTNISITNVTFNNNHAQSGGDNGGALYLNAGTVNITGSTFENNIADADGGAIYAVGTTSLSISNSEFTDNTSGDDGAAIFHNVANPLAITNSTFISNDATGDGGAIVIENATTVSTDATTSFTSNTSAANGGAIWMDSSTLTITGSTFTTNAATANGSDGGAIYLVGGTLTVTGGTFTNNTAGDDGGAIYHNTTTTLTLTNVNFTGNQTTTNNDGDGGAIMMDNNGTNSILTVTGSTFTNNSSRDEGGAIYNDSQPTTITNTTFEGNTANDYNTDDARGGAIFNSGDADGTTITLSTFRNNTAYTPSNDDAFGGAIYNEGAPFTIANVTFTGNEARQNNAGAGNAQGGAFWSNGNANIYNVTFSGNTVREEGTGTASGGNIFRQGGTVTLANTIVTAGRANGTPNNCAGTITNGNNNIDWDGGNNCGFGAPSNVNPQLDNTLTGTPAYFPLLLPPLPATNPAINAGNNTICGNASVNNQSQNGVARPVPPGPPYCDIGSFEYFNTPPTGGNGTVTTTEDTLYTFTIADFTTSTVPPYADADSDALAGIRVTSLETAGTLQCGGVDVILNGTCADVTTLTFLPALDATGSPYATFGFQVYDSKEYSTASYTMTINVTVENDLPAGTDNTITIIEDTYYTFTAADFGFTDPDVGDTLLSVRIDTLPALGSLYLFGTPFPASIVIPAASIGSLGFGPATDGNGIGYTSFTFSVEDTGGPAFDPTPNTITFDVTAVNDTPTTTGIANVNVAEDAPDTTIDLWPSFADVEDADNQLTYTVTNNDNPALFTSVTISAGQNLVLDYAASQTGTAVITVRATDTGGLWVETTFTVSIGAINDEPDFTAANPPAVAEDAGPQTVAGWVTAFNPGPPDEAGQAVLQYIISNSTCSTLLSAGPVVSTSGTLTYTPAANQNGTCTFDAQVQDDGGTAGGGDDTGPVHTFTITVNSVNDVPVAVGETYATDMDVPLVVPAPGVLANDSDADGNPLTGIKDTDPANGTVVLNANGSFTYTPNPLFFGIDSFTYHANDGAANSNVVTVNIGVSGIGVQYCDSGIFIDKGWEFIFPEGSLPGCIYIYADDATMDEPFSGDLKSLDHRIKVTIFQAGKMITNLNLPYEVCYTLNSEDYKKIGGNFALLRIGVFSNGGSNWELLPVTNKKGKACASLDHFSYFDLFQVALPATGFAPDVVTPLPKQTVEYAPLGDLWLEIPRLGIRQAIVGVPLTENGWDVTWLANQIGYLYGTAYPTASGNSVLTAHVYDYNGKPGTFAGLKGLWWGDQVIVHAFGQEYIYEVRQVRQTGWDSAASVLKNEVRPWITLVTCKDYDEATNSYRSRVVVRAVLVDVK